MHPRIPILAILILLVAGTLFYAVPHSSIRAYAEDMVKRCADVAYRPACYDEIIPPLMDEGLSMEDAFSVVKLVQEMDPAFTYCHVLGHRLSAKETAKDPSKWKDVVARAPSGVCSNGAIHGAFQERFRAEALPDASVAALKQELEGICDARKNWSPTGLQQGSCMHALGHLTMYVTAADIGKSLALCDEIAFTRNGWDMRRLCYDGAFMQIFQPLEPDDFSLIEGKEQTRETVGEFCRGFEGPYQTSCVGESAALFREEIKADPLKLVSHCGVLSERQERERCLLGLIYYTAAQLDLDVVRLETYCKALPDRERNLCFANAAGRLIEVDWKNGADAVALCKAAGQYKSDDACYDELVKMAAYNYHPKSAESRALCEELPEPWKDRCLTPQ